MVERMVVVLVVHAKITIFSLTNAGVPQVSRQEVNHEVWWWWQAPDVLRQVPPEGRMHER